MSQFARQNQAMIGIKSLRIDDRDYAINWGNGHLSIKGDGVDLRIENSRAARMLGTMPFSQFIATEIRRNQ